MANKVSEITAAEVADYIRLDEASPSELTQIKTFISVAKAYIKANTGLTDAEVDSYPDIVIAVFVLCQDFYDNRTFYVDAKAEVNKVVDAILGMHRRNFLPTGASFTADARTTGINEIFTLAPAANIHIANGSIVTELAGQTPVAGTPITIDDATVVLNADGTISVTPDEDFEGVISFAYTVTQPSKLTVTVAVTITVSGGND